jgi:acetolactate synthase-1/3 small subunit
VPVVKVVDYQNVPFVERDLMLVTVTTPEEKRSQLIELADIFRAKIADVAHDRIMIEVSGSEEKVEAFIDMIRPFGIVELARTGVIAMPRGNANLSPRQARLQRTARVADQTAGPDIDPSDLPPG